MASKHTPKVLLLAGIAMMLSATLYCRKDKKEQSPQPSTKPGDPPNGWDGTSDWPTTAWEIVNE